MSKANTDYSNTIFYKIYCKDPSITDLYIGHTTNFVQRKHSHKQSCINPNSVNYNYKLYQCIRDNLGWDNWTMEIIGFHNCEDLQSAKVQEQHYFEEYKATLNSVEPSPKRKPKKEIIIKPPKEVLYCNSCNVYFNTRKLQEEHNKRPKHLKMIQTETIQIPESVTKNRHFFTCKRCDYNTLNKKDYNKHIMTKKHNATQCYPNATEKSMICLCGKEYKYSSGYCRHKRTCNTTGKCTPSDNHIESTTGKCTTSDKPDITADNPSLVVELLKENQELKDIIGCFKMIKQFFKMTGKHYINNV